MRLGYLLRDIEAVAGRVDIHRLRILAVAAFGEEPLLVFFSDADAAIFYRKHDLRAVSLEGDRHRACRRVVDGIINKVTQYMVVDLSFVSGHLIRCSFGGNEGKKEILLLCHRLRLLNCPYDECLQVKWFFCIRDSSLFQVRGLKNVFY